jgi:hypothetical protein
MQITRNSIETAPGPRGWHLVMPQVDDEGNSATWCDHVTDEESATAPQIDEVEA